MSRNQYPVAIGRKTYSAEFQSAESFASAWQGVLGRAHINRSPVICRCVAGKGAELTVRHIGSKYFLARKPDTGHRHRGECQFYAEKREFSGLRAYEEGVLRETERGIEITPQYDLLGSNYCARPLKRGVSIGGLLHLIWQQATLNLWIATWKRPRDLVAWKIADAATRISVAGTPLSSCLYVGFQKVAPRTATTNQLSRFLAIGLLERPHAKSVPASPNKLVFDDGLPFGKPVFIGKGVWERAAEANSWAVDAWREGYDVVALGNISLVPDKDYFRVTDLGLMVVGDRYIPVTSAKDSQLLKYLIKNERSFLRPLRFDADARAVLPNYILTDAEPAETPLTIDCEAWGETAAQDYFRAVFRLKQWWRTTEAASEIPELPPKLRTLAHD